MRFLSDVQVGFGRLKRNGLRVFFEKMSETGGLTKPLLTLHRKFPCLYLIKSKNGKILCFENRGLACSYRFLKEIKRIAAFTFKLIG